MFGNYFSSIMTIRIQVAQARRGFAAVVARSAAGIRFKVTRYGQTLAALVPKRDLQKLEDCENEKKPARARRQPG
jgi:antitoxin (DNA-binding transcriptional repressor) of toxin-antitoxin stability system